MKSRPIIFNAPMVRALLDGSKTQTRRVVKPQPEFFEPDASWQHGNGHGGLGWYVHNSDYPDEGADFYRCQHGQVGDQLWVRETFLMDKRDPTLAVMSADAFSVGKPPSDKFSDVGKHADVAKLKEHKFWVTKPSIFMPRWASRITLEITSVRVERLQDITRGDCMAEGCPFPNIAKETDPKGWYRDLWASINGADSWDANPWVWVIEFKKVTA